MVTEEIVWTSANDLWAIERHDYLNEDGSKLYTQWFIYGGYLAVRWPIDNTTLSNSFYPKYVRQAIKDHARSST